MRKIYQSRMFSAYCVCCADRQISGREMFEFNPTLIEGDDDEADDVAYQREPHDDDVRPSPLIIIIIVIGV